MTRSIPSCFSTQICAYAFRRLIADHVYDAILEVWKLQSFFTVIACRRLQNFSSTEENRFGTTWGRVGDDRIFGWTDYFPSDVCKVNNNLQFRINETMSTIPLTSRPQSRADKLQSKAKTFQKTLQKSLIVTYTVHHSLCLKHTVSLDGSGSNITWLFIHNLYRKTI